MSAEITIRRIRESEGEAVVELWSRMNAAVPDGGPLVPRGRRNLRRLLEIASFHRETFCLVAVRPGPGGDEIAGFGMGHVSPGDGLLPGAVGEAGELYLPGDDAGRRRLAEAVVARLRAAGCSVIRSDVAADEPGEQAFWAGLGFEADMVVMSKYWETGGCDEEEGDAGSAGEAG
jgi:hypothetical protein